MKAVPFKSTTGVRSGLLPLVPLRAQLEKLRRERDLVERVIVLLEQVQKTRQFQEGHVGKGAPLAG